MDTLFQQLLGWFLASAGLGFAAGGLVMHLFSQQKLHHLQNEQQQHKIQSKRQQQALDDKEYMIQELKMELDRCEQQTTAKQNQESDCSGYQIKIAQLEKALLDVLKNRQAE